MAAAGGYLWLSVPNVVIHEIDEWSPLAPTAMTKPPKQGGASVPNRFPQVGWSSRAAPG
jgi:hypothetical protein